MDFTGCTRKRSEIELALPSIVPGEYLYDILQSRLRATYEAWVKANLPLFTLLPVVRGPWHGIGHFRAVRGLHILAW